MPPAQRAAQRSLIGLFRTGFGVRLTLEEGLCIFRGKGSEQWALGATELTDHLDELSIPHSVVVMQLRVNGKLQAGFDVRVAWNDLDRVLTWIPSFQKHIDRAKEYHAEEAVKAAEGAAAATSLTAV